MDEENKVTEEKTQEQLDKEEKQARRFFIGFFICVAILIIGIVLYGYIQKKHREEYVKKSLSGASSVFQEAVEDYNEKVDQIIEDMKNDPKLK